MLTQRSNSHHSVMPNVGDVGYIVGLSTVNPFRKCIVECFPLCDSPSWFGRFYSYGIHTIWVRFLDTGQRERFSGIWFSDDPPRRLAYFSKQCPRHRRD